MRRAAALTAAVAAMALTAVPAQGQGTPAAKAPRPRVHLLATGGTISNLGGDDANRRTGRELVDGVPRIGEIADVSVEQVTNVASGSLTQEIWLGLARRITELQRSADPPVGYIVTQGTDTMEETAYFLSLTVGGCTPVVVTGAMRQANWAGADGPANLLNSVRAAIAPASRGRGTVVLMNDEIFTARDVMKTNSTRINAFTAPNEGVLGLADPDTVVYHRPPPVADAPGGCRPPLFDLSSISPFPRVDVVYAYIGADSVAVDALVAGGAKGLVVAGVGRGGSTPSMGRALRRASARGVTVVYTTRAGSGRVGSGMSADTLAALAPGRGAMLGGADLNAQKARILLMLGLAARMDARSLSLLFEVR